MSVVVAVDFSTGTDRVLSEAVQVARSRGAAMWLIHVAEPEPDFIGFEAGPDVVRDQVAEESREEHRQLAELAETAREQGVEVTPLLIQGPIVQTILNEAEKHSADMIVMGTHGHGVVYQVLVGSLSEGVIRSATCSVLLVPVKEQDG